MDSSRHPRRGRVPPGQKTTYDNYERFRRAGYLSPHIMAFALAAWVHARPRTLTERATIERWLEPVQRGVFVKAVERMDARVVRERSGVESAPQTAPARPGMLADAAQAPADSDPIDFAAKRSDTFRVLVRPARWLAACGFAVGAMAAGSSARDAAQWCKGR